MQKKNSMKRAQKQKLFQLKGTDLKKFKMNIT